MKACSIIPFYYGPLNDYENENRFSKQEESPVNLLTHDIFQFTIGMLRARELESFGTTCKHFQKLTENAPMWGCD